MAGSALGAKVFIVSGAAKRIGAAVARVLHETGARVALHYRHSSAQAAALALELNAIRADSAVAIPANLLETGDLQRLVEHVVERFGRLDGLVNNASSFYPTPIGAVSEAHWHDIVGTNLKAPLFLAQAAAPHLRRTGGSIVSIADIHALRPLKSYPLYCAAKAGLVGLTRALALELAPEVRVNAVAPGAILWPEDGSFDSAAQAAIIDDTLLKRAGTPEDIALAVRFLLRDAPYVTGQVLAIDGGRSAHL